MLRTWIDKKKNVWAQMPVPLRLQIRSIKQFQIVELEGITQVVTLLPRSNNSPVELKQLGFEILKTLKLIASCPASGVMFVSRQDEILKIDPVVWVRDIKTLFYETACASGTTAAAIVEALDKKQNLDSLPILQPSGTPLLATVRLSNSRVSFAEIGGPVRKEKYGRS